MKLLKMAVVWGLVFYLGMVKFQLSRIESSLTTIEVGENSKAKLAIAATVYQVNEELMLQKSGKGHTNAVDWVSNMAFDMWQSNLVKLSGK